MPEEVAELIAPSPVAVDPPALPDADPEPDSLEIPEVPPSQPPAHPLQPGGKRFEQVYAQAKQTQRELAEEREKRIRAEAQLEVLNKTRTPDSDFKEYAVDELEAMIATGQLTRADAVRHREEVLRRSLKKELKREQSHEIALNNRLNALSTGIQSYLNVVPDLTVPGTPTKSRVDQEFDWLVGVQGKDPADLSEVDRKAFALTALRNVLGPVETLAKRTAVPNADTHQGLTGGTPPAKRANPDQQLLDKLTPAQVEHYKRMFTLGKYPNKWADVVAELKYDPAARKRK